MMLTMASSNTIIQTVVDDSKRGRVMSFYAMAFMGTAPFGSLFAGAVAKVVGAPLTLAIGGAAVVAGALLFARQLPKIQETILPVYREMGIRPNKSSTQP
ncbi:MFS transporter [Prolixibacter bellariivorans]|nr:MFS transporter [Prolixibacter bellariivorans]